MQDHDPDTTAAPRLFQHGECRMPLWQTGAVPTHAYCCRAVVQASAAGLRARYCEACIQIIARPTDPHTGRAVIARDPQPQRKRHDTSKREVDPDALVALRREGLSAKEIGQRVGASEATIKRRLAALGLPTGRWATRAQAAAAAA
ncbi:hypothetical protein J5Y09_24060 [Roseomonas sp. PWR1]|uniref:Uncharacterized protein n=1 Tax=Roseomonas nitratireducens TaxID=2820810 RepID=A0ABS4B057_9PROT|nr:hypothetical protein [Neoroseomonas nitratireducens]MBP0467019.1 hypothetical protein [Neoroseomonas nitratireducens]